ncbi:MAG: hypothetical protein ACREA0_18420 [bacterium]
MIPGLPGTGRRLGHWVRVIEYTVTVNATDSKTRAVTTRTELFRLLTTITDPNQAGAAGLADCYHQRWESKPAYQTRKETYQRPPRGACKRPRLTRSKRRRTR